MNTPPWRRFQAALRHDLGGQTRLATVWHKSHLDTRIFRKRMSNPIQGQLGGEATSRLQTPFSPSVRAGDQQVSKRPMP